MLLQVAGLILILSGASVAVRPDNWEAPRGAPLSDIHDAAAAFMEPPAVQDSSLQESQEVQNRTTALNQGAQQAPILQTATRQQGPQQLAETAETLEAQEKKIARLETLVSRLEQKLSPSLEQRVALSQAAAREKSGARHELTLTESQSAAGGDEVSDSQSAAGNVSASVTNGVSYGSTKRAAENDERLAEREDRSNRLLEQKADIAEEDAKVYGGRLEAIEKVGERDNLQMLAEYKKELQAEQAKHLAKIQQKLRSPVPDFKKVESKEYKLSVGNEDAGSTYDASANSASPSS